MAEEDKIEEEKKEQEEQKEEQPQRKKFPVKLIIIGILALSFIGGGFFVWKNGLLSGIFEKPIDTTLEDVNENQEMGPIYALDTFIVNLVGGRGKNYLKAKIELELDDQKTYAIIDKRLPQFRDSILTMLSSKTHEDINTLEGKFQLRAELMSTLNQYLHNGKVQNVYFTDFIIQ